MPEDWNSLTPVAAPSRPPPSVAPAPHRKPLPWLRADTTDWDGLTPVKEAPIALGGPTTPNVQPTPKPRSIFDALPSAEDAARRLGIGTRGLIEGVGDVAGIVMNPLNDAINMTGLPQAATGRPLAHANDPGINLADMLGLPRPQNSSEQMTSAINAGGAGGLALLPVGGGLATMPGKVGLFGKFLADAPVVNLVGGIGAAAAQEKARQEDASPFVQFGAGLLGGLGAGAGASVGQSGAKALRQYWTSRGRNVGQIADEELVRATLDGGIDGQPMAAPDVEAILRGAGAAPENFTTDALAVQAAERIARARGRRVNVPPAEAIRQDGINAGIAEGIVDPSLAPAPPPRVMDPNTPIFAAPEGNIRGDDAGGIAGLERKRAADENILSQGRGRASADPIIAQVIDDPNLSTDMKTALVGRRIRQMQDDVTQSAAAPIEPFDPSAPYRAPTAEAARRSGNTFDRMLGAESGNRQFGADGKVMRSPKGATGAAQVMPETGPEAARLAGLPWDPKRFETDGDYNRKLGEAYHAKLLRDFDGDERLAAAAYNAGPGRVSYALKKGGPDGWEAYVPKETRDYVRKIFGDSKSPPREQPYRIFAPDNQEGDGFYGSADRPGPRNPDDPMSAPVEDRFAGFEDTRRPTSPTNAEFASGKVNREGPTGERFTDRPTGRPFEPRMNVDGSSRAFRDVADDPAGQPGFWEDRARKMADDITAKRQADLEAEWARRREEKARREEAQRQRDTNADASQRYEQERTARDADPQAAYGGKYDQRPHKAGDYWNVTPDGFVAGKEGRPVAFRNAREAAKWAAANEMGGDFELHSYGSQDRQGNQRIVLKRRDGSTYGQAKPETDTGAAPQGERTQTDFERATPPAGRSSDRSQRAIGGESPPDAPSGGAGRPPEPPVAPTAPTAPYRPQRPSGGSGGAAAEMPGPPREEVVTPSGRKLDTQFEVRNASDLITSDDARFDQRFQPRDRPKRAASDDQVAYIASRLDPEQLHSARLASTGAPIIGPDGMVESGNGRVMAIRRAYDLHSDKAEPYRKMIEDRGFDTTGIDKPVLVRRRLNDITPEERAAFAFEGQDGGTMAMSAEEKVKADAKRLTDDTLNLYRGGDVDAAGNRDFVKDWMEKVILRSERNAMMRDDGTLSNEGITRLRSTLLAKAFDDPDIIAKVVSDPDSEIVAIGKALTDTAPAFASLKAKIAQGDLPAEFDITPNIAEAAKLILRARQEGKSVGDLLKQGDVFSGGVDPITEAVAGMMFRNGGFKQPRGQSGIVDGLRFYTDEAARQAEVRAQGDGLFGGVEPVKPIEIAQAARERLVARDNAAKGEGQGDLGLSKRVGSGGRSSEQSTFKLRDELRRVADDGGEYGQLAAKLNDLIGDDATVSYGLHILDRGDLGFANSIDNRAGVISRSDTETLLHEALHLAAIRRYGHDFANLQSGDLANAPVRDLLDLFNEARAQYERGGLGTKLTTRPDGIGYALSSPDEFFAMALTNRSTQKFLERGSLWDRLVDGVRKLFRMEPRFKPMLDRVLKAGAEILDAAKRDPERPVDGSGLNLSKGFFQTVGEHLVDTENAKADFASFKAGLSDPKGTAKGVFRPLRDAVSTVAFSIDSELRGLAAHFNSDAITELADRFLARSGKGDGTARTYHEAVQHFAVTRVQQSFETLAPFVNKPASLERIRALLTHPTRTLDATPGELAAAKDLRRLLKETIDYRKAAGEDIGEVSDGYFPRVIDVAQVAKDKARFIKIATQLYRNTGADDPAAAADAWFNRIYDSYSGLDGGLQHWRSNGGGLAGNTAKAREFGKEADKAMREFYHDDMRQTLASYFTGSARRAEETRIFGAKGAVNSAEREAWVREHGDKTQLDVLTDRIKADVIASGKSGADVMGRVRRSIDANLGRFGSTGHGARNMISFAHAWNQLSKMDRTTLTSLGELTMGFIRGGPKYGFGYVKDSMVEFGRQLRGAEPSDAARWAEAIGVAQDAMVNQALTSRIGAEQLTQRTQQVMAAYYKGILLHQFTEGERAAATKMGQHFLKTLAHDMESPKARTRARSERYLAELGVKDAKGFAEQLRQGMPDLEAVRGGTKGHAADYGTALLRFVNQTVIQPSRAEKPLYASHPVGSMFYSLLGYSYGFKKQVLDRTGRMAIDAIRTRDPHLLIPAAMLPIMGAFQYFNDTYLRPTIFGSNYDFANETATDAALRVADKAGFTGALSPVLNAFKGVKYQRGLAESLAGPVVGSGLDAAGKIAKATVFDNPNTNTDERNAAAALYDLAIEPGMDATVARYVKNPLARTVGIMATGNKRGGVVPGDKDAFVDAVAGPKEE